MEGLDWLIWGACFLTGTFFIYGILHYAGSRRMVRDRFKKTPTTASMSLYPGGGGANLKKRFLDWISSFGKYAMKDKEETSKLRFSLIQAGYRNPKAPTIFLGIRVLAPFLLALPYLLANAMAGVMANGNLMYCLLLAATGFYVPPYILKAMIARRQERLDRGLPDVLDLLIVCVEGGLSLQSALHRVSDEVRNISLELYHELHLTNAELRTGISRELALKNFGERTGAQTVKSLVGIMIQSDKMGTSIAQALRVHSDFLRVQRAQQAEERAGKLPVKIMIPLLLFIFPAIMIIVIGPAVINTIHALSSVKG
ncbi:MAG: type II secretion system F family protein [Desulfobaccales bacterium]